MSRALPSGGAKSHSNKYLTEERRAQFLFRLGRCHQGGSKSNSNKYLTLEKARQIDDMSSGHFPICTTLAVITRDEMKEKEECRKWIEESEIKLVFLNWFNTKKTIMLYWKDVD